MGSWAAVGNAAMSVGKKVGKGVVSAATEGQQSSGKDDLERPEMIKDMAKGTYGPEDYPASPDSYKRGGKVKRTGKATVHKGERVLTKKQAKKYDRGKKMSK